MILWDRLKDAELGRLIRHGHYDEIKEWVIHSRAQSLYKRKMVRVRDRTLSGKIDQGREITTHT